LGKIIAVVLIQAPVLRIPDQLREKSGSDSPFSRGRHGKLLNTAQQAISSRTFFTRRLAHPRK
jgi:hypothetical protein